jgi:hypothetical protein
MRRLLRLPILLAAVVALAVAISACAVYKPGSFQVSQPAGIGDVRFHLALCSEDEELGGEEACNPGDRTGQAQLMLAFAVPKGSTVPATVTAAPGPGATPIVYSRNQEVADRAAELPRGEGEPPWPPPGSEIVGYLSSVIEEKEGETLEWTIDANVGLPAAADGGSFGGPIGAGLATGWRAVGEGLSADRPIDCAEGEPPAITSFCGIDEELQVGVSDLKIPAPTAVTTANLGAVASIPFSLDFASSASPPPSFALSATTTLPGAAVALPESTFVPPSLSPGSRAPLTPRVVNVTVPADAQPGGYDITLTATAAGGGKVSQVAKLTVSKLKLGFGKLKRNKAKGIATLQVKVPAAGTLTMTGRKVVKAKRSPKAATTVKLTIRAKGKAKKALNMTGKAKVKANLSFRPQSGSPVLRTRSITLKKSLK